MDVFERPGEVFLRFCALDVVLILEMDCTVSLGQTPCTYVWVSLSVGNCEMRKSDWSTLKDNSYNDFPNQSQGWRPASALLGRRNTEL